ncbi:MAG: iron ABC transporter permease [Spirochaetaceae bacterium]|jgi:iron(III) transport system permease protein|nr:iron ABC transporter permease [Spirochaetaceae bacterium]
MKKNLIKLLIAALVFAGCAVWMTIALLKSFRSYHADKTLAEVTLWARTVPKDSAYYEEWLSALPEQIKGGMALILELDEEWNFHPAAASNLLLKQYWETEQESELFQKALESIYYLVPYTAPETIRLGNEQALQAYFLPVLDESGFDIKGALLILIQTGQALEFERLLINLALVAWVVFVTCRGVALLARDPLTGYSVIGLFFIAGAFIAYPLFEAFRLSFTDAGRFSLAVWQRALSAEHLMALWGSIKLGIITASVSTVIGFIFAFFTERTGARGKKLIGTLATMPVISPPFSLTLSIILLFGNNGLITHQLLGLEHVSIYGLGGLVLVQTISMFPIAYMTLASVLRSLDSTIEDAALDLSASRLRTFCTITLPLAVPGLLSAWLLVFTTSLADFANPLLLAGSYRVLSVETYIEVTGRNNLGGGAALSLLLLMPTLTAFFAQRSWVNKKSVITITGKPSTQLAELATKPVRFVLAVFVWTCMVLIVALYSTIVAGCFVKNWGIDYTFTLSNIAEALSRGKQAITSTVILAAAATPLAGLLAMIAAVIIVRRTFIGKRVLEVLLMTPFAVPGTLFGIAYILAFNKPPLLIVGTAAIIVINFVIRELPVGLETGAASLRQIDPAIEEAAQDLGADSSIVFTSVVLPLIRPAFLTSMSYTFVRSMTAVSAVIFLISAHWYHLTIQIYNFSENLRFGLASVLSTVLIIIVLAAFGIMQRIVKDKGLTVKQLSR